MPASPINGSTATASTGHAPTSTIPARPYCIGSSLPEAKECSIRSTISRRGTTRCRLSALSHHGPAALPVPHRNHDHAHRGVERQGAGLPCGNLPRRCAALWISDQALVTIASRRGSIQAKVKVSPKAVAGTVFNSVPLCQGRRQPPDPRRPRSDLRHPEFKVCAVKLSAKAA